MRANLRRLRLLAAAWACLALARAALALLPFRVWRPWLAAAMAAHAPAPPDGATRSVVWAVRAASAAVPGSTCLTRALAAGWLLRRSGGAQLIIGVATGGAPPTLEAHAWLERGGVVILGGEADVTRFARLPHFPTRASGAPLPFR